VSLDHQSHRYSLLRIGNFRFHADEQVQQTIACGCTSFQATNFYFVNVTSSPQQTPAEFELWAAVLRQTQDDLMGVGAPSNPAENGTLKPGAWLRSEQIRLAHFGGCAKR
jgi:hypothetical protein